MRLANRGPAAPRGAARRTPGAGTRSRLRTSSGALLLALAGAGPATAQEAPAVVPGVYDGPEALVRHEATGFREEILRLEAMTFGEIAHVLVLYEAMIPGRMPRPQEGVDSFHLVYREGRWWIAGVLNEVPTPERPVPERLRPGGAIPGPPTSSENRGA